MHISDEDLIEYLLGDVAQGLRDEIDRQLEIDPSLAYRLRTLRKQVGQIDSIHGVYEPPADLVEATLARIVKEEVEGSDTAIVPGSTGNGAVISESAATRYRSSFWDSTALTMSLTLLCCLVLPAIVRARFESRKVQCANNLRLTGAGLIDFAMNDPDQRFPHVDLSGPFSFAGVYALHLKNFGIPLRPTQLRCASLMGTSLMGTLDIGGPMLELQTIPTFSEYTEMAWTEPAVQRAIGGDYAYNLGVSEGQRVVAPRNAGRTNFAILADSPVFIGEHERLIAHDGRGLNILYEDGRVFFLHADVVLRSDRVLDHPFRNLHGVHAFGLMPQDASLAPSHFSPTGVR